eukprot:1318435-Pyramimonas_sp.AAC.1
MGSLWGSRISSKLKLLAFQGHVIEAGLSANEAYVFSEKMTNQMDTIVAKCLRVLERGKATDWGGSHLQSLPHAVLRRRWK